MSGRNRPRQSFKTEDIADEQQLWGSIVDKIKRLSVIEKKVIDVKARIKAGEEALNGEFSALELAKKCEELESLYRDGVRLAEEETKILHEEPDDLIRNLDTLISVKSAFESDAILRTSAPPSKRGNLKRRHESEAVADSPAAAPPEVTTPQSASRAISKVASRSGSVASVSAAAAAAAANGNSGATKVESDTEAFDSPGVQTGKFVVGSEVFYKSNASDGLGYLAKIVGVIVDNKQSRNRYKVKDIDPESKDKDPEIATMPDLMAIPALGTALPPLTKGRDVFAVYPYTTTIYNAKVIGMRKDMCRLIFENDDNQEIEVTRRYVLDPHAS